MAVCLLFDNRSDRRVRELWSRLEAEGIATLATHTHGRHHPHLSYAVLRSWDQQRVQSALADLPRAEPFSMTVHGTLTFPGGRAALAPSIPPDVALRQARTVTALREAGADLHRHYEPGDWVPHISAATRVSGSQIPTMARIVADFLPITLRVDRAALIDTAAGESWPLPHIL